MWKTLWKCISSLSRSRTPPYMSVNVWDQVLAKVEAKVNRHSYFTWFKPTGFVGDDGTTLTVRVPNPLFKDWLTKHYAVVLEEALQEVGRPDAVLAFQASDAEMPVPEAPLPPPQAEATVQTPRRASPRASIPATPSTPSSSGRRTSLPMPPAGPLPRRRRCPTTRSSSTAAWASARPTSCTPSGSTSCSTAPGCTSPTSRPSAS